jgi:hypothetical protein
MPAHQLSVDERLRIVRSSLAALHAVANVIQQPISIPTPLVLRDVRQEGRHRETDDDTTAFVSWTELLAQSMTEQIDAITGALTDECINLDAPLAGGER